MRGTAPEYDNLRIPATRFKQTDTTTKAAYLDTLGDARIGVVTPASGKQRTRNV